MDSQSTDSHLNRPLPDVSDSPPRGVDATSGTDPGLDLVSIETLQRLADRMDQADPSLAPEFAGAIAAALANRLEGAPLGEEAERALRGLTDATMRDSGDSP